MDLNQLIKDKREEILQIAARHGAYNVRVFGSVARGEAGLDSDLDLLIDMEAGRTLFDLGDMTEDLQDLLHRKVNIAETQGLSPIIRDHVLKEAASL
jgi:uncharacterized protein